VIELELMAVVVIAVLIPGFVSGQPRTSGTCVWPPSPFANIHGEPWDGLG